MFLLRRVSILLCVFLVSAQLSAQEIILWHSMDGELGEIFRKFVTQFNEKPNNISKNVKITPVYKGTYDQTLSQGLKVLNTKEAPHILQVYEMGNLVMQANPNAYIPLNQLTGKPSALLEPQRFLPAIREFYKARSKNIASASAANDKSFSQTILPSLPFSASSVILFYNKDAFRKAGLDADHPPKTWEEFEKMAKALKKSGAQNILAAGWLSGHHIDQTAAWHNQPIATKGNGVDGDEAKLKLNQPFFKYHLAKLAKWFKEGMFSLDTGQQAESAFAKEEIVLLTQGANRLPNLEKQIAGRFELGVGYFPYWKNKISTYQNTVAGGASFWALKGHPAEDYEIVQAFFEYLVDPKTQAAWHQQTCYMPVVVDAQAISEKQKFYTSGLKGTAAKIALSSFSAHLPTEYSRGILLPNFPRLRDLMIYEMKEAIQSKKTVEEALEVIDEQGNRLMHDNVPSNKSS